MAEYIGKANLVERLENRVKDYGRDCNSNAPIISRTYQAVLHMVENLPTADVVPVVRCGECVAKGKAELEPFVCSRNKILVYNNCFCSYGKRRCEE